MIKYLNLILITVFLNGNDGLSQGKYITDKCDVVFDIHKNGNKLIYSLMRYKKPIMGEVFLSNDGSLRFENLYSHFYDTIEDKKFPPMKKAYIVGGEIENNDTFLVQNYGNAMNPYIIFDGCGKFLKYQLNNLHNIIEKIKNNNLDLFTIDFFKILLQTNPFTPKNLTTYNNIAYYLQKAGANEEAVYLLEKIIKKFPNRTVAYYNLGDSYWELGEKKKAINAYTTYIEQMCHKGLQKKIPKVVLERVTNKR